jgi:hypothetical protein
MPTVRTISKHQCVCDDCMLIFVFYESHTHTCTQVKNIDLYNMMCHIIGAEPAPNNGTFSKVKPFLVDQQ